VGIAAIELGPLVGGAVGGLVFLVAVIALSALLLACIARRYGEHIPVRVGLMSPTLYCHLCINCCHSPQRGAATTSTRTATSTSAQTNKRNSTLYHYITVLSCDIDTVEWTASSEV